MAKCWNEVFPFVEGFEDVVAGEISYVYMEQLEQVLEPAIDMLSDMAEGSKPTREIVVPLVYCVAAMARLRVARAYRQEVERVDEHGSEVVLAALDAEWSAMIERDSLAFVQWDPCVSMVLGDTIETLWAVRATASMLSARVLMADYGRAVSAVRVVPVGEVLVQHGSGKPLASLTFADQHKCVLPITAYRVILGILKEVFSDDVDLAPHRVYHAVTQERDLGFGSVSVQRLADWMWLVLSSTCRTAGYCYQLLLAPVDRSAACKVLGPNPWVSEFLWYVESLLTQWSLCSAVVDYGDVLHVVSSGNVDLTSLAAYADRRIGMAPSPRSGEPDYFARALVDDFVKRHRRVVTEEAPILPVDMGMGELTLDTTSGVGSRGFMDVAATLYDAVDEMVSPRAEYTARVTGGTVSMDEHVSERDSHRVKEVYSRLLDGAVIDEGYFRKSRHRLLRLRPRPRLCSTVGHSYHLFAGFPADGGGGVGPWELDKEWDIPGWQSYIAVFDPGTITTVSFISPEPCTDIRMDCTGEAALEFGDCKVATWQTVLWFSTSVKFKLITKTSTVLRISVPDAGSAMAMSVDLRRYLYIPGYATVAHSFDVVTGAPEYVIALTRTRKSIIAGCHLYSGRKFIERGRHRFKLTQLPSVAPVKMVLKTDPVQALQYLTVCGMRLKPRTRDYVTVLFDIGNAELYVSLDEDAEVQVSLVQVVRVTEFDLTVASMRKT